MENNCNCPQPLNVYNDICGLCLKQLKNKKSADEIANAVQFAKDYLSAISEYDVLQDSFNFRWAIKDARFQINNLLKCLAHRDAEKSELLGCPACGEWYSIGDKRAASDEAYEAEIARLRLALEEIKAKEGYCVYGSMDTSHDPEIAFRQGSAYTYSEVARMAAEALTPTQKDTK